MVPHGRRPDAPVGRGKRISPAGLGEQFCLAYISLYSFEYNKVGLKYGGCRRCTAVAGRQCGIART